MGFRMLLSGMNLIAHLKEISDRTVLPTFKIKDPLGLRRVNK